MTGKVELLKRIQDKEFVVSVQIDPPISLDVSEFLHKMDQLKKLGVNLVDINSRTVLSYDSIGLAGVLSQEGFEVIPHITSRPSSVLGLVDWVRTGYAFFGIKNYLIITGDPYRTFDTRGVFEMDSIGIIKYLNNHFRDQQSILDIGFAGSVNQNAADLAGEGTRIQAKEQAGADFFMSQPAFSLYQASELNNFYRRYSNKPLLLGVWPLIYSSMIEKIRAGDIRGVVITEDEYSQTLQHSDRLREWGLSQAGYLIDDLRRKGEIQGVYIVAPARNPLHLTDLLERILS